ncbi:MAG: PDZ domain-containing protein [bacterium]|nr:PDZ domain-containing protein [bacterium]
MPRLSLTLTALACLVIGFLAFGAGWQYGTPEPPPSVPAAKEERLERLNERVDRLAERLDEEVARHAALEERLASALEERPLAPARESTRPAHRAVNPVRASRSASGFDPEALLAAGFFQRDVEAYAETRDDVELRRLALRDRATREGWMQTPRYATESRDLSAELVAAREAYGEEFSDWALFASGQPNRLGIGDVISGSPAAAAGLEPGDILESYAGSRIQAVSDLHELTVAGRAGESTPIEVRRDGSLLRLTIPRGPLGVRVNPIRQEPPPPR